MVDYERQLLTNDRLSCVVSELQTLIHSGTNIRVLISSLRHLVRVCIQYELFFFDIVHYVGSLY